LLSVVLASAVSTVPPREVGPEQVPAACRPFTTRVPDARDDTFAWNQQLSLAACVQDTSKATVSDAEQADALFQELGSRLMPTMRFDIDVLRHAPLPFRIRAAYQLAMANVSLVVRMRSAVADPGSPLHAYVESLVDAPQRTAWLAAALIVQTASRTPELVADPVTAYQVQAAGALLEHVPASVRADIEAAR
jgi:hypothetical protein